MKSHWFGLLAGMLFYCLALIPGLLPHRADMLFMILSGTLVAITGHPYALFIVAIPSLGLALFGLRQLLNEKKTDETK